MVSPIISELFKTLPTSTFEKGNFMLYPIYFNSPMNPLTGFMSPYHRCTFLLDNITWSSVEHYYQAQKHIDNLELFNRIRLAKDPREAKEIAESVPMVRQDWDSLEVEIMKRAIWAKFKQNINLAKQLLDTGERELVSNGNRGRFWDQDERAVGRNMLGRILMEVRQELRHHLIPKE